MEVVYGIAKRRRTLEWVVSRCVKRQPPHSVMPYLLVGLYQILIMDNVAGYAAVNETVEAVRSGTAGSFTGLVNGVLRRVLREVDAIRKELESQPPGIRESHPDVLLDRWTHRFGSQKALELCRWNNSRPQVTIRPNRRKIDSERFLESLGSAGLETVPHPFAPHDYVILPHGTLVTDLPGYTEGLFTVHDPSAAKAVDLLNPQPGQRILDACAAPGGKTQLIGEKMQGKGRIAAMDLHRDRLLKLSDNLRRMGLDCVKVVRGDALLENDVIRSCGGKPTGSAPDRLFDGILLDVPCTNTGVLRRRPDARWRFSLGRLGRLVNVQRSLLGNTARFLKPGGCLVYSTCSLEPEECESLIESWTKEHTNFELVRTVELFPPETQTDGIYAAAIYKAQ